MRYKAEMRQLRKGNITGVLQRIRKDFIVNSYFVTGYVAPCSLDKC
jgi:hypothetical protein